ncbi:hypothetical protein BDE02_04G157000 [Populus trichocarpa]|nr:hypothetical protein BDE02_04G157000 [Populus trichocarpa]
MHEFGGSPEKATSGCLSFVQPIYRQRYMEFQIRRWRGPTKSYTSPRRRMEEEEEEEPPILSCNEPITVK